MPFEYTYGRAPTVVGRPGEFRAISLPEVMYYLYLPILMADGENLCVEPYLRLPPNIDCLMPLISAAALTEDKAGRVWKFIYISARKGWATPDSPLNRPGWHCDGFGTDDRNYVWWKGPGTRFAVQVFKDISTDHLRSLEQFKEQRNNCEVVYPPGTLLGLDPGIVHATPLIAAPGCMRQYVKISFSDHRYNLYGNSHNYLFDYNWPMVDRDTIRNDTHKAQRDYN